MKAIAACSRWIDWLNEKIGFGVSWLTSLLVLVVCFDVFTRYVLSFSIAAVQELEWHLFALIFLFGAAYTLRHDKHVRVDIIYARLREKTRAWIDLLGSLIFLIPFCVLIIWVSIPFIEDSFSDGEGSPNPSGLPARYLLKTCIPLAFALLALQGISLSLRSLVTIFRREES